ncbi:hypothetical protein [Aquimarina algicola]|uniref:DUF4352 domain-containing protein n=1 Tax=Aquimarina algicola TaxID=2589995 RepID=A0A504JS55_9FLAO|nr:hypothetical protein [Aquimarina algicola]TPN89220.1 hypothetical protein FHK87_03055 [Aquimarina algicola]
MKKYTYILILVIISTSCGSFVYNGSYVNRNASEKISEDFQIDINVLEVNKRDKGKGEYKIDYELVNNSDKIFTQTKKKYFAFFIITTTSGKEIGHYERIFDKIHPGTTVIKDTRVDLSTYTFESISASIYIE